MRTGDAIPESDRADPAPHPRETSRLFGHGRAEGELLDAYRARRLHHAWLIGGPEGIGKATLAWRFARFLLANPDPAAAVVRDAVDLSVAAGHPAAARIAMGAPGDVAVLRRAWNDKTGKFYGDIRVDEVRRASGLFQQAARGGGYRICILDSAEDLNASSANALLKLVEEPPALSLFLIVAHHPAKVLPTLRSRCRALALEPPAPADAVAALSALGPLWSEKGAGAVAEAVGRAGGSVKGALRYLEGDRMTLDRDLGRVLSGLPEIDWRELHRLADRVGTDADQFDVVVGALLDWIHGGLRAGCGPRRLAALAEVWDKVRRSARDTLALNLDKKSFLFSTVTDLAQAVRAS